MAVRGDMVNGHHICHGGMIFSLADTAFAYACNSYNKNTVASACNIDFLAPGKEGEMLEAEAIEQSQSGRTGVYDVTVRRQRQDHRPVSRQKLSHQRRSHRRLAAGRPSQINKTHRGDNHDFKETPAR
jgi:phenylacetic acid degradation protein PaaD